MGFPMALLLRFEAMGSLLGSAMPGFLSVQAVTSRPVPKAKIAKKPEIKETALHSV